MLQTLKKGERLCSRKQIKELFEQGKPLLAYPIKLLWKKKEETTTFPVQVVIAVPKRNIRKAVLRNKIKRKLREAYRKNKYLLNDGIVEKQVKCTAAFIFTGKEDVSYKDIESKIIQLLLRLKIEYAKDSK